MVENLRPNQSELFFLNLAYNRFYDISEEILNDDFWREQPYYRFSRIKEAFGVYNEITNYEPVKWVLRDWEKIRPPSEGEIASEFFKFIRHLLFHFPFFDKWDEVWFNKMLINWHRKGQTIDLFLSKNVGRDEVKYRIWEPKVKKMTYLSISFPKKYDEKTKIYLKNLLSEKDGNKFSLILMKRILKSQVISSK